MNNKLSFLFLGTLLALSACQEIKRHGKDKEDILVANLDTTTNPADDFFQYAEGGWIKRNPIPADQTNWGIGQLVQEELYSRLRNINEEAVKKNAGTGIDQKIGAFWLSGMDTVRIEKNGLSPLNAEFERINAAKTPAELMSVAAHLHTIGVGVLFSDYVSQDAKNSDLMSYSFFQGGLGMPNRDYYFNNDARTTKIRNAYPGYVSEILSLLSIDPAVAKQKAASIIALETTLAKSSRSLEALRDPYANYNKMAISQLKSLSPNVNWPRHIDEMGAKNIDSVIIGQPEFYKQLDKVVSSQSLQTLKDYMSFHLIRTFAPYLNKAAADANFNFYSKLIRGAEKQKPRWKRVLDAEENAIGEALGQLFAKEYFDETAKKRYSDMVENVRNAYKARIEKLNWMTDSTKQKALHKLAAIKKKVGYPDKWKDFSSLQIDKGPFVLNMLRSNQWWNQYQMNKLGKPVNRDEWDMTPQTYNAYYNPSNNEIVLPAGIFVVPGYRDDELDDPLVYGYAAASTVGHEITHGFDDEGRQYDEYGNLKNWWTKKDEEQFTKRADVLVQQFNNIVVVDTAHIRGKQTLGENLADLGGLLIGLDAFKQTESYKKGEKINGLTPLQRYFLGYALGWMYNIRMEQMASQLMTDVHSPAKYRVNGPMPNIPEFYEAFNVQPGNKMYLPDSLRVRLW
jgi:putative endopeptidase